MCEYLGQVIYREDVDVVKKTAISIDFNAPHVAFCMAITATVYEHHMRRD